MDNIENCIFFAIYLIHLERISMILTVNFRYNNKSIVYHTFKVVVVYYHIIIIIRIDVTIVQKTQVVVSGCDLLKEAKECQGPFGDLQA